MTSTDRLRELAPNLTPQPREILAKRWFTGLIVSLAGLVIFVSGDVIYGAAIGFGPLSRDSLIGFIVLTVAGLIVVLIGLSRFQSVDPILRGASATSHPEDRFTASDAWTLYARKRAVRTSPDLSSAQSSTTNRHCPFCGRENSRDYKFCRKCGKSLPPPL